MLSQSVHRIIKILNDKSKSAQTNNSLSNSRFYCNSFTKPFSFSLLSISRSDLCQTPSKTVDPNQIPTFVIIWRKAPVRHRLAGVDVCLETAVYNSRSRRNASTLSYAAKRGKRVGPVGRNRHGWENEKQVLPCVRERLARQRCQAIYRAVTH